MKPTEITANDINTVSVPYLLFFVGSNTYGIDSKYVCGIERLGQFTTIVNAGPNMRGGVLYQNSFIPLIDMRKKFGLDPQLEEFEKTVYPEQRIKDHENWVAALEKSVRDRTEFNLTDDPHQCALGKWYYSFKTDNNVLKHQLKAIEAPHEAVHNTAKTIKELMLNNKYEQALSVVKEMQDTHYKTTLHILSSLRDIIKNSLKEVYVVIDAGDSVMGIIVDSIIGVEGLYNIIQMPESMSNIKYSKFLGRRKKDNSLVFILDSSIFVD